MARPIGARVKLWMRWHDDVPPTPGMFVSTQAGRWYEVVGVRQIRTEQLKFDLSCIVRGNEFTPPVGARTCWLIWDPRGRARRSRAPVL